MPAREAPILAPITDPPVLPIPLVPIIPDLPVQPALLVLAATAPPSEAPAATPHAGQESAVTAASPADQESAVAAATPAVACRSTHCSA